MKVKRPAALVLHAIALQAIYRETKDTIMQGKMLF